MLDWIFEGVANWVASIMTQLMDAVSGLFLDALGTDMTAMEEYLPFVVSAYNIIVDDSYPAVNRHDPIALPESAHIGLIGKPILVGQTRQDFS